MLGASMDYRVEGCVGLVMVTHRIRRRKDRKLQWTVVGCGLPYCSYPSLHHTMLCTEEV